MLLSTLLELFADSTEFVLSIEIRGLEFHTETITKQDITQDVSSKLYVSKFFPYHPATLCCVRSEV